MKDVVDFLPPDAVAYLRFADGDARFPVRPVPAGDFLIGSGADCDLRLGDGVLPPLHSVLRVSSHDASWTRLVRTPELFVNGESVRQIHLHDGDLVELGPFRLVFRFAAEQAEFALSDLLSKDQAAKDGLAALPALHPHQLVDAIERELNQLQQWDHKAQHGILELLDSVSKLTDRFAALSYHPGGSADKGESSGERDSVQQLLQFQADRIESLSEVLEHVIRQQRVMTDVLHGLTERLSQMTVQSPVRRRAS